MRTLRAFLLMLALASCAETKTVITGYDAGRPLGTHVTRSLVYGKHTTDNELFGNTTMGNLDVGFGKLTNMVTALTAAYAAADIGKVRELTKQLQAKGLSDAQIAKINAEAAAAAAAAKLDATKTAIGAGAPVNPITITPP